MRRLLLALVVIVLTGCGVPHIEAGPSSQDAPNPAYRYAPGVPPGFSDPSGYFECWGPNGAAMNQDAPFCEPGWTGVPPEESGR